MFSLFRPRSGGSESSRGEASESVLFPGRKKALREIGLLFAAFWLPGYLLGLAGIGKGVFLLTPWILLKEGIPRLALCGFILFFGTYDRNFSLKEWGCDRLPRKPEWLLTIPILLGLLLLALPIAGIGQGENIGSSVRIEGFPFDSFLGRIGSRGLLLFFSLIIGYSEELFFRVYLVRRLAFCGAFSLRSRVLVSNLLFGLGHLYNGVFSVILTFFLGCFLSYWAEKKKSIHPIALAHGLYDNILMLILTG